MEINVFDESLIPLSKLGIYLQILRMVSSLPGFLNALIFREQEI